MPKKFNVLYHFKDGDTWGGEEVDVQVDAEEVADLFKTKFSDPEMVLVSESTNEKKIVKDLKSIELLFRW
ncbi:hypothetical protein [Planococcus sp. YIM B11945]|uniref:hypothetical protein n=1 Tax=Planococcus sp. YIM B11945 TaxID=3435410 RepID=UPI003D7DA7A5